MQTNEVVVTDKAGIIPYYIDDSGVMRMLFMVPSDPEFGGPHPQIAKGGIDPGETAQQAAVREGGEELGLRESNVISIKSLGSTKIKGLTSSYTLTIFAAQVKDPKNFSKPHYETKSTHWLTLDQFMSRGRANQRNFVSVMGSLA